MNEITDIQFARLFQAHAPALAFYARQWSEDSQDIVQEAFMKLAAQSPSPDRPVAWLYQVVRNLSLNCLRNKGRRNDHLQQWAQIHAPKFVSEANVWSQQDAIEALEQLNDDDREIVVAKIWGGLSFQEISDLVGKPPSTCHRRYQQALSSMKQRMEDPVSSPRET